MASEQRRRSVAKMLSYRAAVVVLQMLITYYYTGNIGETTLITIAFNVGATAVYYLYERAWNIIPWGRVPDVKVPTALPAMAPQALKPTKRRETLAAA